VRAFSAARDRILLTQAYFVPPARLLRTLYRAVRRGVRVAVILGGTTDNPLPLFAARGLYPRLLRHGVEVYEWTGQSLPDGGRRVLHAKTAVVDDAWSTVGSSNLDPLSLRQNLEVNAVFDDARVTAGLAAMFEEDLRVCERVHARDVLRWGTFARAASSLAYRIRDWL
jgi:cardiolipin synthase